MVVVADEATALKLIDSFVSEFHKQYAFTLERLMVRNLNDGVGGKQSISLTGNLARSIHVVKNGEDYEVIIDAPYWVSIEYGSEPHWVPIKALKDWARRRFGDESIAYPVQKKIAKEGTTAHPFVEPAEIESFDVAFDRAYSKVFG